MKRHAEIAGAGFGGLIAAIALAQRGWTVRVHERTPFIRAEGFGVAIHQNGIKILEALGVFDAIRAKIPMGRFGQPEEAAAMVAWIASDDCSFTTGFAFDISGGRATY